MDDLQKKLAHLSPQQRAAVLKKLQEKQQSALSEQAVIKPIDRNQKLPLSYAQERLWFISQYEQHSATYNIPAALQLDGVLHIDVLQKAVNQIIQRHEVLRTQLSNENGQPFQQIVDIEQIALPVIDVQHESELQIQHLINDEAAKPFNLASDIPIRISVLKRQINKHILLITLHHIAADGWSIGIFVQEFSSLYQAFLNQQPNPLLALQIQYADFAHWQRQQLTGDKLKKLVTYWKNNLTDAPKLLALPLDKKRPAQQTFNGNRLYFDLNEEITHKLQHFSQQHNTTLFVTLLAIFSVLLNRYTQQDDIVIGSPIANRTISDIEPLIGFFVNTLALRTQLKEQQTFTQLVEELNQTCLNAYQHQALPF